MSETTLESKMENLLNQKKQVKLEIFEYKEGLSIREKLGDKIDGAIEILDSLIQDSEKEEKKDKK